MLDSQSFQNLFSSEALILCKDKLKKQGYINFMDLPDDFDHVRFLQQFGPFMPQSDGKTIIWSVKYEPSGSYNSLGLGPLLPHTEGNGSKDQPAKYVALWCVKPAECGGGQTTLADGYAFIISLTKEEQHQLSRTICKFGSNARVAYHPVYDLITDPMEPIIRFSTLELDEKGDRFIIGIRQRFSDFFKTNCEKIAYKKNSLVLWNNWRMVHGRTDYKDPTRELKRIWIAGSSRY
jgi:hypothetical protein